VRIVPCIIVLAFVCGGFTGCQLFNKKDSGGGGGPFLGSAGNAADKHKAVESSDPLIGAGAGGSAGDGLLTGQVIDARTGKPVEAQIRWVCLDDPKEEEAPIDVMVNQQGYFTIAGLKSGKYYKLVARAKSGERVMTGVSITRVPDTHMLIRVSEDFTPVAPQGKQSDNKAGGEKAPKKTTAVPAEVPTTLQPAGGWTPGMQPPSPTTHVPPTSTFADPSKIAAGDSVRPPPVSIAGPKAPPQPAPAPPTPLPANPQPFTNPPEVKISPPVPPSTTALPPGPAPVPSCVLVANKLDNFALFDTNLSAWEYSKNKHGKLMLLDFWMTHCPPCRAAIHPLKGLQEKYGPSGLEVVGIAFEEGTLVEQAQRVKTTANYCQINYLMLLGGGKECPVRKTFQVERFPTLVLLDESGAVVWWHEGGLDRANIDDLDSRIKTRLLK
jgi:thiol-disulfide isomerase/thioredoxin